MSNYFIIHGSNGNPNENWFPWLSQKLMQEGKKVIIPHFPDGEKQNYDNWSRLLIYYLNLNLIDEDTVFICHSVASIFICKFLIKNKVKIKALISVSGFNGLLNNEFDEINKTFLMEEKELAKVEKFVKYIYCFYSNNDSYVNRDELEKFIYDVKGYKNLVNDAGHFNSNTEFPQMLEVLEKMEKSVFKGELL